MSYFSIGALRPRIPQWIRIIVGLNPNFVMPFLRVSLSSYTCLTSFSLNKSCHGLHQLWGGQGGLISKQNHFTKRT